MGKTIVGVDIGTLAVRAVEVEGGRKSRSTVVRWQEVALPEGAVKSGEVIELNTVATLLKQLWSEAGFKSKDVVLGMGNAKVLVRDLTVPKLNIRDIRAALPFQVQDMLPVPVSDALLDFYPISEESSDTGPVVNGLLVAAVKEAVASNVTAVQLAGLNTVEVDVIPFALNRLLVRGPDASGTVAIVDIGANTTNVLITTDGVPQFARIITAGGADVTKALAVRLGITPQQAEVGKKQLGLAPENVRQEHREAADIVAELTNELLNSLRNTLSFFINSRHGHTIDRVVLSGGGSTLTNLASTLAELTRIPVRISDPLENVSVAKNADRSDGKVVPLRMSVALGLALGSVA